MAKIGVAFTTARTGEAGEKVQENGDSGKAKSEGEPSEGQSVRPLTFKTLVGRGHPEFSSGRQQVSSRQIFQTRFLW